MLEKLKANLEKYQQMRQTAFLNWHRLDAVVALLEELVKQAETQEETKENEDG